MVEVGDSEVTIYDEEGKEIVKWVRDEWELEPEIVSNICNAIDIFHREGESYLKALIST